MKHIKLDYPKTSAEAIRAVCYLRAWTAQRLAKEMGMADGSHLSRVERGKSSGSPELTQRILQHMPEKYRPKTDAA